MTGTNCSTYFSNTQPAEDTATDIEKLIRRYPYLLIVDKEKEYTSSLITAAKNIRIELKKAFPNIKFSVTTQRFAGGDSIDISWTDGVAYTRVENIVSKYQYGKFNGMEDIYEYNDNLFNDVFGAAKYVSACRHQTSVLYSKAAQLLGFTTTGIHVLPGCLDGLTPEQTAAVQREITEIDAD